MNMAVRNDQLVTALAMPMLDPAQGRVRLELPEGLSVYEIIRAVLPDLAEGDYKFLRVTLISGQRSAVVPPRYFARVRPYAGVIVTIRLVPGNNVLKSILSVVVSIAAVAIGQVWVAGLLGGGVLGAIGGAVVAAGITILGSLLINALIPSASSAASETDKPTYYIQGWKNAVSPGGRIPEVYGRIRFAPPFAVPPYSEIVGDVQYVRCAFLIGYGGTHGVALSDFRLGDTSLDEYDEFTVEVREGLSSDQPLSLVANQVAEQQVGAELARPYPRDDLGNVISGSTATSEPVTRTTGADASGASIIIGFPAGLGEITSDGTKRALAVDVKISYSPSGAESWTEVATLSIAASKLEALYRQHSWSFPSRGRYDVKVERMTAEHTSSQQQSRTTWVALQTIRPEYPIAAPMPLALVALRVKATYQINGSLDNFNLIGSRRALTWDAGTSSWIVAETQSPASAFRHCLQSPSNPKQVGDDDIDLNLVADWFAWCASKGLNYNAVHDDQQTLRDRLTAICAAGRAVQRHDGIQWGVVIDRPTDLIIDELSPRTADQFKISRPYVEPPDGFRVKFQDETNDYKQAERIVPWPGHSGEVELTEELSLPGKTDPDEIWIEARRRMYEAIHRPDTFSCRQDGPLRAVTRGDHVAFSHYVLSAAQLGARCKSVYGRLVELDELVTMEDGETYGIRFRTFEDDTDQVGTSNLYQVLTKAGETDVLEIAADAGDARPVVGTHVLFGKLSSVSEQVMITRLEQGEGGAVFLRAVASAPIVDERTDAEEPPAWSGRAGADVSFPAEPSAIPVITSVRSGFKETGIAGRLLVSLAPGSSSIATAQYRLQHRLSGATVWTSVYFPAANSAVSVSGYDTADLVDIRASSLASDGTESEFSEIVSVTIGTSDAGLPKQIDASTVSVSALLGGALVLFQTTDDEATTQVQVYRSSTTSLDPVNDAIGAAIEVTPSRSYTAQDGDTTRTNLVANGAFDSVADWTLGTGWSIGGGVASHASGSGTLEQAIGLVAEKTYRILQTVSGRTTGTLTPRISGGTIIPGSAISANGASAQQLTALSDSETLAFLASSTFNGSVDDVVVFQETSTCLASGTYYYWLEPINADGIAGPVAGPFSVAIR